VKVRAVGSSEMLKLSFDVCVTVYENNGSLMYEILLNVSLNIDIEKLKVMVGAVRNEVTIRFNLLIYMLGCGYSKCFGILFIIFLAVKFHIEFLHYLCSESSFLFFLV
jgi:hypothetical protein